MSGSSLPADAQGLPRMAAVLHSGGSNTEPMLQLHLVDLLRNRRPRMFLGDQQISGLAVSQSLQTIRRQDRADAAIGIMIEEFCAQHL